jgi:hypothetical protein
MPTRESHVVKGCQDVLAAWRIPHFRNNSGVLPGAQRPIRFGAVGWPDLIGVLPGGRFLGIECKAPKCRYTGKAAGRQTAEQKAIGAAIDRAGGLYLIVEDAGGLHERLRILIDGKD